MYLLAYELYKTDCSEISKHINLSTTYKILSNILLSKLAPYAEEIIRDHQCGFGRNRSTAVHIAFVKCLRTNGNGMKQSIGYL